MEFCPKCGTILIMDGKRVKCPKCSYRSSGKIKIESSEKIEKKAATGVVKEKDIELLPVTSAICKKCGHNEAYFWSSQTRAADEAETRFFRCKKCSYTWREYR
jgi:DNA-directed RNA polymerase subunit M